MKEIFLVPDEFIGQVGFESVNHESFGLVIFETIDQYEMIGDGTWDDDIAMINFGYYPIETISHLYNDYDDTYK